MGFFKAILFALAFISGTVLSQPPPRINARGNVIGAQAPHSQAFLIYQSGATGDIVLESVSSTFQFGQHTGFRTIVPANEVLWGTPLAIAQRKEKGDDIGRLFLFFFSPDYKLKEYQYGVDKPNDWDGGSGCNRCIDKYNFEVQPGSQILYAMRSAVDGDDPKFRAGVRVGFVANNYPGTLSEADRRHWEWKVFPMPN
ncbi:hypothetical protein Moror_3284 [Moniliophthora roreri MCA 2997]|uniref:Uncharacterized protein n=1 Tax=Moniliophthora roreri (strain MCA 2997) TaxID=1381753 RepID=V2XV04_MONRO|nr:hypothetical protein Moror_3284 [Moniliophthora roreri MCA 2997]